jgi:Clostripain family
MGLADPRQKMEADMATWTIMVYFSGDTGLGQEMIWALKAIRETERPKGIKVVALFDGGGPPVTFTDGDTELPRRAEAKVSGSRTLGKEYLDTAPQQETRTSASPVLAKLDLAVKAADTQGRSSGVDSIGKTLQKFVNENIEKNEATDHYMLVLSGHGSGVVGEFLNSDKRFLGLSIPALKRVLRSATDQLQEKTGKEKKIDILGLDSCEMSMAEVAYEVRHQVNFMVGAEGFEPRRGWPYELILPLLKDKQNTDHPEEFAPNIVTQHIEYYFDYAAADISTDASALQINEGKLDNVIQKLRAFTEALGVNPETGYEREERLKMSGEALSRYLERRKDQSKLQHKPLLDAIVLAHRDAQGYKNEQYADLWDFCDLLSERLKGLTSTDFDAIRTACENLRDSIDPKPRDGETASELIKRRKQALVLRSGYCGPKFQHSHGLSIFFPWAKLTDAAGTSDLDHYQLLDFAQRTAWDEFLRLYHHATIRPVRRLNTTDVQHFSLLNRRSGLFTGTPGAGLDVRDPQIEPYASDPELDPLNSGEEGKFGSIKIASMKNPPIEWRECKLD